MTTLCRGRSDGGLARLRRRQLLSLGRWPTNYHVIGVLWLCVGVEHLYVYDLNVYDLNVYDLNMYDLNVYDFEQNLLLVTVATFDQRHSE